MRTKLLSFFVAIILLTVVAIPVFADNTMVTSSSSAAPHNVMQQEMNSANKTIRQTVKQNIKEAKDAIQQQKQQLKADLQKIKDQRKQQVVEKINDRIININTKYTGKWTTHLNSLQTYLDTLKTKSGTQSATTLNTDISNAQTDITNAQAAVDAQAAKVYTIQITSDATLRSTVGQTVSEFRTDLVAVHSAVMTARQAVLKVALDVGVAVPSVSPVAATGSAAQL